MTPTGSFQRRAHHSDGHTPDSERRRRLGPGRTAQGFGQRRPRSPALAGLQPALAVPGQRRAADSARRLEQRPLRAAAGKCGAMAGRGNGGLRRGSLPRPIEPGASRTPGYALRLSMHVRLRSARPRHDPRRPHPTHPSTPTCAKGSLRRRRSRALAGPAVYMCVCVDV